MRYDDQDKESSNVEDRRGQGGGFGFPFPGAGGGRGIQIPIGGGMSLTTLLIIGGIMLLLGINPLDILRGGITMPDGGGGQEVPDMPRSERQSRPTANDIPGLPGSREAQQQQGGASKSADEEKVFISRVLKDTEDVWGRVFQSFGRRYEAPQMVLFSGGTRTACGIGQSAMGPFYCPIDQKIYIDLGFYDELSRRFKAPGDFAKAYVIAHEVGHHIQLQLGIAEKVQQLKERMDERQANALQVRMELQADCLAGVWANVNHQMKQRLEQGDIEEGLNAASQIGDDMIQKKTQGRIVPDAFTHGSSAQRTRWFRRGFESGQMQDCDTFNAQDL